MCDDDCTRGDQVGTCSRSAFRQQFTHSYRGPRQKDAPRSMETVIRPQMRNCAGEPRIPGVPVPNQGSVLLALRRQALKDEQRVQRTEVKRPEAGQAEGGKVSGADSQRATGFLGGASLVQISPEPACDDGCFETGCRLPLEVADCLRGRQLTLNPESCRSERSKDRIVSFDPCGRRGSRRWTNR